ncbi:MAG TPA: hypothetical protein VGD37_35595 [Kofleriaceae bacterium]
MLRTVLVALALCAVIGRPAARANPAGDVASAGPAGDERVQFRADYELDLDSATITREHVGDPATDGLAPLPLHRELEFHQTRQRLTPQVELGVYRDVWVSFAVPIVLAQSGELDLAAGVDRTTATTFTDGILPANGFDAQAPATPPSGDRVFRGASRSGVPELRGGVGFAPMNQARDDTKPTWKLGAELRFAIGRVMRFDAVDPGRDTGVSTGVHELRLWTSVDRRFRYFEGWFEAFYQRPIYTRATAQYQDPGFGSTNVAPAQTAGAAFGIEAYLTDSPASGNRLSVELGGRLTTHFEGRGYSEMWEAFAFAGDRRTAGPLVLDADPTTPGTQALSHPGVTNIENYLETSVRLALRGRIGHRLTLSAIGDLGLRTEHVISFTDAGVDLPTCPATPRCETDDNSLVNPGTQEVNPLHARRIDLVGHRYHASGGRDLVLGLEAHLAF